MKETILQLRSEFGKNGPGTQALVLAREMARRGHRVVFASSAGVMDREIEKEFKHYLIPTLEIHHRGPVSTLKNILALRKIIRDEEIDVIHGHNAASTYCALLGAKLAGRRVLATHSIHGLETRKGYGWRNWLYRVYPATLFAVSEYTRAFLIRVGAKPERVVTTYNGINLKEFDDAAGRRDKIRRELGVGDEELLIGEAGVFSNSRGGCKGQYVLIDAFARLLPRYRNLHLAFCGDGPDLERCKAHVRELRLEERVHFRGFRRDIPDFWAAVDIASLPSVRGEMFPISLLEAMAMGKPWVSTRLAGIPEISEDGKNGLLAEPGDAVDLAEKLERLIVNPELRKEMGEAGYRTVREKFTIAAVCDRIEAVYAEKAPKRGTRK